MEKSCCSREGIRLNQQKCHRRCEVGRGVFWCYLKLGWSQCAEDWWGQRKFQPFGGMRSTLEKISPCPVGNSRWMGGCIHPKHLSISVQGYITADLSYLRPHFVKPLPSSMTLQPHLGSKCGIKYLAEPRPGSLNQHPRAACGGS